MFEGMLRTVILKVSGAVLKTMLAQHRDEIVMGLGDD